MSNEAHVFIRNRSGHALPAYATPSSAGMDVRAKLETPIVLQPGAHQLIPTGLFAALPVGTELQVRPRSGLAFKHGITVLNAPGTIDADYRGEIGVLLINHVRSLLPSKTENALPNWSSRSTSASFGPKPRIYPKASGAPAALEAQEPIKLNTP